MTRGAPLALVLLLATACTGTAAPRPAPTFASTPPTRPCPSTGLPGDTGPSGLGVVVDSTAALRHALARARPGETVVVAPGVYHGQFDITTAGTAAQPVVVCATGAVLDAEDDSSGYALHLDHASHWIIRGLTVRNAQKGVVLDASDDDVLAHLTVYDVGEEAVHLRSGSSDDTLTGLRIRDTGRVDHRFGEGVYVGSAVHNWCRYSGCRPDRSDRDRILASVFGPGIPAEAIDLKEGTTGGLVAGDTFDGTGITTADADAFVDLKGNDWTIRDTSGSGPVRYGVKVHVVVSGWGNGNVLAGNRFDVPQAAYGFFVQTPAQGTVVGCDNRVSGAAGGTSNVPCTVS